MFIISENLKYAYRATIIAGAALALSGCGSSIPDYPGSGAAEPTNLTEAVFEKATISLAPGWEKNMGQVDNDTIVIGFKKDAAVGIVFCFSSFLDASGVGEVLHESVLEVSGNAQLIRGPFAVSGGLNKPYLEIYQGTSTSEGQEMDVTYYLGYNSFRYLGCNYGMMLMHANSGPTPEIEADFVAMFRTLK